MDRRYGRERHLPGSVRPVGKDRWEARVYAGLDPITRRQRQVTRRVTAPSKRAAQKLADGLAHEVERGAHVSADLTFGELLERWIKFKSPRWSPNTLCSYQIAIAPHPGPPRRVKLR
jgi:hypothetical protein